MKNEKELVRYAAIGWGEVVRNSSGEYVRYDQAAEVIAKLTKDANHQCRERVKEFERAEAAEAELAKIKKENIEKLADLISKEMIKSAEEISDTWANNLIYGNNEDDDSNSGLSSALSGKEQS